MAAMSLPPSRLVLSCRVKALFEIVTFVPRSVTSTWPSWCCTFWVDSLNGAAKTGGNCASKRGSSVKLLPSIQTRSAFITETLSYSEFQRPPRRVGHLCGPESLAASKIAWQPAVFVMVMLNESLGSQLGNMSNESANVMFRITMLRALYWLRSAGSFWLAKPRRRLPFAILAVDPTPMMDVFEPTSMTTRSACACWKHRRASSRGPVSAGGRLSAGSSDCRIHRFGSYAAL